MQRALSLAKKGRGYVSPLGEGSETTHDLYSYNTCGRRTEYSILLDAWDESAGEHYVARNEVEIDPPIC